jgi:hypothetical protein
MDAHSTLGAVVALCGWSMVMWVWMYATRIPAVSKAGIDLKNWVGGTGKDLDQALPANVQWKAHNLNHLMEQPTVFYAICIVLHLASLGGGLNATLAWAYVALRIIHSIVQATWNRITVRFTLFILSSLVLGALCLHAAMMLRF